MNIAVAADGESLESNVSEEFEICKYLLILNMDDLTVKAFKNELVTGIQAGARLADEVVKHDCEALITGKIQPPAFNRLADACITRFFGFGISVKRSLDLMEKNKLKIIRNSDGTDQCSGHHDH